MRTPVDLDEAAAAIERRRPIWTSAGFEVGEVTWRDVALGWPYSIGARQQTTDPDSVGVRGIRGTIEFSVVLFGGQHHASYGSWADVEGADFAGGAVETNTLEVDDLSAFEQLLDSTFERWAHLTLRTFGDAG